MQAIDDLALLIEAAHEAGRIATSYVGTETQSWDKPDGAGPVTEADFAVNRMLETELQDARPDYGWLSEESDDTTDRLERRHVFIIDPIDGTRSFVEGSRTWAHSLAVAEDGIVSAAVIYLPQRDLLYAAASGQGATLNGNTIAASETDMLERADILSARPNMDSKHWKTKEPPAFKRSYRPSLAYRMALVAQGRFDGMLTLRPSWEWDIAAGDLILREAGGVCSDRNGAPLRFNNSDPRLNGVVAGGRSVHRTLTRSLVPSAPSA